MRISLPKKMAAVFAALALTLGAAAVASASTSTVGSPAAYWEICNPKPWCE